MTTDMQAGAEMDRLVAEKVMGFTSETENYRLTKNGWYCLRGHILWSPSTEIEHAWKVVEKLHRDGAHIVVINCPGCDMAPGRGQWAADVILSDDRAAISIHADTAPLAICRAALMAVAKGEA